MKKVQILCPACSKIAFVEVEETVITESERGITAIDIGESVVCEHEFVAYIDQNFTVRDCYLTDFKIKLPQIEIKDVSDETIEIPEIDIFQIMVNIGALTLAYTLRACLFKKKICILHDNDTIEKPLSELLEYCFKNMFEYELKIINRLVYKIEKKKYKDYIIIENENVSNDKNKLLDQKTIKIENVIIQKFLAENDSKSSMIILKNEIRKAYLLAKDLADFLNNFDRRNKLIPKLIYDMISEKYHQEINDWYLKFLIKIVKYYFNIDIAQMLDFFDHMDFMWYVK